MAALSISPVCQNPKSNQKPGRDIEIVASGFGKATARWQYSSWRALPAGVANKASPCLSVCGKQVEKDSKFCRHCGAVQEILCPGCGKVYKEMIKFCSECGSSLEAKEEPSNENA